MGILNTCEDMIEVVKVGFESSLTLYFPHCNNVSQTGAPQTPKDFRPILKH